MSIKELREELDTMDPEKKVMIQSGYYGQELKKEDIQFGLHAVILRYRPERKKVGE
jgi:translation elongation factor EF-1beta